MVAVVFNIRFKLFSTLLLAVSSVVLCMYLVMQWSFDRGFLNYVNKQDQQVHEDFAELLRDEWLAAQSWQPLRDDRRKWGRLMSENFNISPPPPRANFSPGGNLPQRDRFSPKGGLSQRSDLFLRENRPPGYRRPPPKREGRNGPGLVNERLPVPNSTVNRKRPERENRPPHEGPPPPLLLDENKHVIFGPTEQAGELTLYPIIVSDQGVNKTVGYIGQLKKTELTDQLDLSFVEQQSDTFSLVAALMLFISMLAAFPAAAHLVKPIKRLMLGTQQLTRGQYETTIPVTSKDELGQLSLNFNSLALTLKENEKARQQWVADISHELRTPLAVLKGEIEAIQDGVRQATPDAISSLHSEVEHLNRLIGDLYELSMSDIGALNYQKEKLRPVDTLLSVLESFCYEFEQKGLALSYDDKVMEDSGVIDAEVFGDATRLKQLFSNLLKNTLRYTNSPGQLKVEAEMTNKELTLHFKDSSPGVSEHEIGLLFERLYRVEASRNRALGGAGLGLSICSNIVQAHDGRIKAKASPYGGVWICVSLPLYACSFKNGSLKNLPPV